MNEATNEISSEPFGSKILGKFLNYLEKETGKNVSPADAVFHREYAKYRQSPYPDLDDDKWRAHFMVRTWINVLLHEGMTGGLRKEIYPEKFDLGNLEGNNEAEAKFSELLREINGPQEGLKGEKEGGVDKSSFGTVLKGIQAITGRGLDGVFKKVSVLDLKVIKLLYRITKKRASHLFGLIAPPGQPNGTPTMEFRDSYLDRKVKEPTSNDEKMEENELLIADLTAYLSVEIPDITLKGIHSQLLTYSKLLEVIDRENREILDSVRYVCIQTGRDVAPFYQLMAEIIENYPTSPAVHENTIDQALYTYMRSLHFQHFVGGYEKIVEQAIISEEIKPVLLELERLCKEIGESDTRTFEINEPITSVDDFPALVKKHSVPEVSPALVLINQQFATALVCKSARMARSSRLPHQ
ncbi:hypothetical protein KCU57_01855 [Xanthomonas translucens]|uniref:hypothetical protein n=1 Tax=Xanthomonas campestris pv. translucens TaxID=343 RepID=UPI001F392971|nr:hypothetical protein [Xanthomonas translucens]UKE51163.1 hypothetical protein KCU57_01855 [Xanthomonas translucens]